MILWGFLGRVNSAPFLGVSSGRLPEKAVRSILKEYLQDSSTTFRWKCYRTLTFLRQNVTLSCDKAVPGLPTPTSLSRLCYLTVFCFFPTHSLTLTQHHLVCRLCWFDEYWRKKYVTCLSDSHSCEKRAAVRTQRASFVCLMRTGPALLPSQPRPEVEVSGFFSLNYMDCDFN